MKRLLATTLLCSALFITPAAVVQAGTPNNEPEKGYITVSYTTEKKVSPDTVEVSIAVKTDDKTSLKNAAAKNKEISDKVYEYLKSVINTDDGDYVKTSNYTANPVYNYVERKRILDKYEVSNNVIVHTKKLDKISQMIDKSLTLGATNVASLHFSLEEKDNYCSELLAQAAKKAGERANIVAGAANTSVTGIKNITTSCSLDNNGVSPRYLYSNAKMAMGADSIAEDAGVGNIESGLITIYSNVNAAYYVK